MISMLGDGDGHGPGGFLLLDEDFSIAGRWEHQTEGMHYNYDYWYQPRSNVMISTEFAAPNTYQPGFHLDDVAADRYGHRLHFWDWQKHDLIQSIDLGQQGLVPLEIRFQHNPMGTHAFVGAALSSTLWHCHRANGQWQADQVIAIPSVELEDWPMPLPALITDLVLSMDDRYLYCSNWLHGDLRQYDVSDPSNLHLTGQIWLGGLLGKSSTLGGHTLQGGPQMLQLSLDGKRLYVTNSLLSSWDNQFYPDMAKAGSSILQVDCDTEHGGIKLNENFYVDFSREPAGPARAHEMHYPGGDCTSDIWL